MRKVVSEIGIMIIVASVVEIIISLFYNAGGYFGLDMYIISGLAGVGLIYLANSSSKAARKVIIGIGIFFLIYAITSVMDDTPTWDAFIIGGVIGAAMLLLAHSISKEMELKEFENNQYAENLIKAFNKAKKIGDYELEDAAENIIAETLRAFKEGNYSIADKLFSFCLDNDWYVYKGRLYSHRKTMSEIIAEEEQRIIDDFQRRVSGYR
ncbi:MAG: hypothetical protein IJH43_00540 [Mogibacterium sp.]|nr:hypothetical protein [Mogibacterium sp.]